MKYCPFCGAKIPLIKTSTRYPRSGEHEGEAVKAYTVVCNNMNCIIYHADNWYELSEEAAIKRWDQRAAEAKNEEPICADCDGIAYRQTKSGKVIPIERKCAEKFTPPCYQPEAGGGCVYMIYGDNNDEPIDKCKECPLCTSDKSRKNGGGGK